MVTTVVKGENPQISVGYWAIRGMAQSVRLLMEFLDVPYEEKRYKMFQEDGKWQSDWAPEKPKLPMPFPNLPYLIDKETDVKISQTRAILRYLSAKYRPELLGSSLKEQAEVEVLLGAVYDFRSRLTERQYNKLKEPHDVALSAIREKIIPEGLQPWIDYLGSKPFLMGDELQLPDFVFYEVAHVSRLMAPEVFRCPEIAVLGKYLERVQKIPQVKAYIESDHCIQLQVSGLSAPVWNKPEDPDFPRG